MKNLVNKEEKDRIDLICGVYNIKKYTIKSDGYIDVAGDVELFDKHLTQLPLKFGKIRGSFKCFGNDLTTLLGAPHTVGLHFECHANKITSLEGGPSSVGGNYSCGSNKLDSLIGVPSVVGGSFDCSYNSLSTLIGGPLVVGSNYYCLNNSLTSLEGLPTILNANINMRTNRIRTTYSGNDDILLNGAETDVFTIDPYHLPKAITDNIWHLDKIMKYQRFFEIWNDDLTLSEENFKVLLDEINDGLE